MTDKITNHSQQPFKDLKSINPTRGENESPPMSENGAITNGDVEDHQPSQLPADTHDFIQEELEKEIEDLVQDLMNYGYSRKETIKDLENENSECIWEVKKKYIELKAKLSQHLATKQAMIKLIDERIIRTAYKKCEWELKQIKQQPKRESNQPRDWYNRLDELKYIYAELKKITINEAENELKQKLGELKT